MIFSLFKDEIDINEKYSFYGKEENGEKAHKEDI